MSLGYQIKILSQDRILISGNKTDSKENSFGLYELNLKNEEKTYILPSYLKYGCKDDKEYKKAYMEKGLIPALGIVGYVDYTDKNYFFVWEGKLSILRIERPLNKVSQFGQKTANFTPKTLSSELEKYYKERNEEKLKQLSHKVSNINGIFCDDHIVGLIYYNYRQDIDSWQAWVQFYNIDGKFLGEQLLPDAVIDTKWPDPSYYYLKEKSELYFLARYVDEEAEDSYKIEKYLLKK